MGGWSGWEIKTQFNFYITKKGLNIGNNTSWEKKHNEDYSCKAHSFKSYTEEGKKNLLKIDICS